MLKRDCHVRIHTLYTSRLERNSAQSLYILTNINDVWVMDLVDLGSLSKYNDKYEYSLNVIDMFPRYAWSVP